MQRLDDTQSRLLMTMVRDRDRVIAEIEEYIGFIGRNMEDPVLLQRQDGFYLAEKKEIEGQDKPAPP